VPAPFDPSPRDVLPPAPIIEALPPP